MVQDGVGRASSTARRFPILYVQAVSVSFDGFQALDNLNLTIQDGGIHCIIGPNGAGKTTLLDVITGKTRADAGTVFYKPLGSISQLSEAQIARGGIGRKFQRPTVFENHSVFENLMMALKCDKGLKHSLFGLLRTAERERIQEVLGIIGLRDQADRLAGGLAHGQKQWLEIGMLLAQEPQMLLLDEPVAGMTPAEIEHTIGLLHSLAASRTVVVVEHDMEFVHSIAQRVTVLHEGRVIADGDMDQVRSHPKVIEVYLGDQ
ncbi:MAG: urea ABC transporter ATP-binding protein UrtD [Desulfarculus sp.]|nr:urea ABC transporter ATP-binding protein UrtD [Desulfarculus sp.]